MKVLRIRIVWIMVFVALVAFNFTAVREWLGTRRTRGVLLTLGALPMANILTVGIVIGLRRPGSRLFLLGFEAFGVTALALYVALATYSPRAVISYLELLAQPLRTVFGQERPAVAILVTCSVGVVMLGLPLLAFALIGGFLARKLRVAERPDRPPR